MKRIVDEELRFRVVVNGNEAQKSLLDLENKTRSLTRTNKEHREEKRKLKLEGKTESKRYKELTSEMTKNSAAIRENKTRMASLHKEIGIAGLTTGQLSKKALVLRLKLRNMIPDSKDYIRYQAELRLITTRLSNLKNQAKDTSFSLSRLADGFNKYQSLAAAFILTITGIAISLQKLIDFNGKFADAQSNVMKTTKMTKKEVDDLTLSFGLLQTRTSRINLLKVAEEGGRIGIVKEEIQDFVRIMNKATVALGDTFPGGVAEVASKLGKLKFLFEETKDLDIDVAYNAIGSALNELGAQGIATELNVANFATRVGTLPKALKPSVAEALALGAGFEESGIQADRASRSYGIFLKVAANRAGDFARVMGLSTKEVEGMINASPIQFFLEFSRSLQGMDATDISKTLQSLGVNADGANKVIGAAGSNIERFTELLGISNKALIESTSLTSEYEIKNTNLAAIIEKVQKKLRGLYSSQTISEGLNNFLRWFGKFIGAVEDSDGSVTRWRNSLFNLVKVLLIVTAAVVSYNTAVKLTALFTNKAYQATKAYELILKITTATQNTLTGVTLLGKAAFYAVTFQLGKARQAMIAFNLVSSLSPIGIIAAVIAAAAVAYYAFSEAAEQAATKQSLLNDGTAAAVKETAKEINNLQQLLAISRDRTQSLEERAKAVAELNRLVPEYNNGLTLESVHTLDATNKLKQYTEQLIKAAKAKYFKTLADKKATELAEIENSSIEDNIKWYEKLGNAILSVGQMYLLETRNIVTAAKNKKILIDLTREEIALANKLYLEQLKINNKTKSTGPKEGDTMQRDGVTYVFSGGKWKKVKKYIPPAGKGSAKKDLEKEQRELLALQRKSEDDKLSLLRESYQKQKRIKETQHKRNIEDLKKKLIEESEFDKIDKEIGRSIKAGTSKKTDFLIKQKEIWRKKNKEINSQIESEAELHNLRLGKVQENAATKEVKRLDSLYKEERNLRRADHDNQIASLKGLEAAKKLLKEFLTKEELDRITSFKKAKKALDKEFKKKEILEETEHLKELSDLYKSAIEGLSVNGIDFTLLTEDQAEKLFKQIAAIKAKLAALKRNGSDQDDPADLEGPSYALGEDVDILGFTPQQWDQLFDNLSKGQNGIHEIGFAISSLSNLWNTYGNFVNQNENARLKVYESNQDQRKQRLKERLDAGMISEAFYERRVSAIDKQLEKKRAQIEYNQAKRQKEMAILNVLSNTAQAIMSIWAQVPKFDFGISAGILTGFVSAMGALQLATIIKQPLPARGFEEGLYHPVRREQDNKMFNAKLGGYSGSGEVDTPTLFLAGEQGKQAPELIIDGDAYKKMDPNVKSAVLREVARVKGFETGYYKQSSFSKKQGEELDDQFDYSMVILALNRNSDILEKVDREGLLAIVDPKDTKSIRQLKTALKDFEQLQNENLK